MADYNINSKQSKSFIDKGDGTFCRQVCGEVEVTGVRSGSVLKFAEVVIDNTTWTDLTAAFTDPIVVSVQNKTGEQVKLNGNSLTVGYVGIVLDDEEERNYNDLAIGFEVYAKSEKSTVTLFVEAIESA